MQGFNMGRYYAPSTTHAPVFNNHNKTRTRPPTVRFEMPFAVWCETCSPATLVGQGVRFNAEKEQVGNYYSTPVWQFSVRHSACGGRIVVRTDPRRAEYVVVSGGRRRDYGEKWAPGMLEDGLEGAYYEGLSALLTPEEKAKRKSDAMAALEERRDEKKKRAWEESRIEQLRRLREKDWADPGAANRKLRKPFRERRKQREREEYVKEELQQRLGLGVEIVEESAEDCERAKLVGFGLGEVGADVEAASARAAARPLFNRVTQSGSLSSLTTSSNARHAADIKRRMLQNKLKDNTRAAIDAFSAQKPRSRPPTIVGLKKQRTTTSGQSGNNIDHGSTHEGSSSQTLTGASEESVSSLVHYDSNDE